VYNAQQFDDDKANPNGSYGTVRIIQDTNRWGILPSLSILKLSTHHWLVGNASEAVL
jgi:hypothetical protein